MRQRSQKEKTDTSKVTGKVTGLFLFNRGTRFGAKRNVYFRNACIPYLFVRDFSIFCV